jgi:hypothetical protein
MILKTFDEQRLERLKDSICEYLDDSDGSADKLLADLKTALTENQKYFVERTEDYDKVLEFFQ